MKLTTLAACIAVLTATSSAMPMSFGPYYQQGYGTSEPRCRDNGNEYKPGSTFTRERDQATCTCSFEDSVIRVRCTIPFRRRTDTYNPSYNIPNNNYNQRQITPGSCVYEGQTYPLGHNWRMNVNGVMMDCSCNTTGYLYCSSSTQRTTHYQSSVTTDTADIQCRSAVHRIGESFIVRQAGGYYSLCVCNNNYAADCSVLTDTRQDCQFPFEEDGRLYSTCRSRDGVTSYCFTNNFGGTARCLTTLQEIFIYHQYVVTYDGTSNGAICHFPFTYDGVVYYECATTSGRRRPWCATTNNYQTDQRYGYCEEQSSTNSGSTSYSRVFNQIGETARLECRYDDSVAGQPDVKWYKLVIETNARQLLGTFDASRGTGVVAPAGTRLYQGRLSLPSSRFLEIQDMKYGDAGTFECDVSYPGQGGRYVQAETSLESIPSLAPGPYNIHYEYYPTIRQVKLLWENPETDFDNIKIRYKDGRRIYRANLGANAKSFITSRLVPGREYTIWVYAVTDGVDSQPATFTLTLPDMSISNTPVFGQSGQTTPSEAQPLVHIPTENQITLNWISNPFSDAQTYPTSWLITYEDAITNEIHTIPLSSSANSYTIEELQPGNRYRIKLFALLDDARIQVASTTVDTEHRPIEISGAPNIDFATPHSVRLTWNVPEEPVNYYEVSYKALDGLPNTPRTIETVNFPTFTLNYLRPNQAYDISVTPISNSRRGVPSTVTVTTPGSDWSPETPQGLVLNSETRNSFRVSWNPVQQPNIRYKLTYQPLSEENIRAPIERTTTRTSYTATYLQGGVEYIVKVYAVVDNHQGEPAVATTTTIDEVCRVNNVWYGANEKFYKRNQAGYMQNCTCFKAVNGGRWSCDPIICIAEGRTYTVDQTWTQTSPSGLVYQNCVCKLQGADCEDGDPVPQPQSGVARGTVGSSLVLSCPHNSGHLRLTVRWFKVHQNPPSTPIYVYHGELASGHQETSAGNLHGRMEMLDSENLKIEPLLSSDVGTYECIVTFPNDPTHPVTHRTRISLSARPIVPSPGSVSIPAKPRLLESSDNTLYLTWEEEPSGTATGYLIQYRDIYGENGDDGERVVYNTRVELSGLHPSTTYRITIIPLVGEQRGDPVSVIVSTNDQPEVTPENDPVPIPVTTQAPEPAPIIAPRSPLSVRFYDKQKTSLRVVWDVPYYTEPIDHFLVTYKPQGSNELPNEEETNRLQLPVYGLEPGTPYLFTVSAVRDDSQSAPVRGVVTTNPVGSILVQTSNRVRQVDGSDVAHMICRYDVNTPGNPMVTWYKMTPEKTEILSFNTSAPEGNQVTIPITAGDLRDRLQTTASTQLVIEDLKSSDDGTYLCEVVYPSGFGSGQTRIDIGVPYPPVITSPSDGSENTSYILSWRVEPSPRTDTFHIKIRRRGSTKKTYSEFNPRGNAGSFLFRGLRPGKTYEGSVAARNHNGMSTATPFEFTILSSGEPDSPTGVRVVSSEGGQIVLGIDGPRDKVQIYRVRYVPSNNINNVPEKTVDTSGPNSDVVITDFLPNTKYNMVITAVNGVAESSPLNAKMTTPRTPPPAPTGIRITDLQPREVSFEVEGPSRRVNYYLIEFKPRNVNEPRRISETRPREVVTVYLEPDTEYDFRIRAVDTAGIRSPSYSQPITTPRETNPPNPPVNFVQVSPRSDSVRLEWYGNPSNVDYYTIQYQADGDTISKTVQTPGLQQSATIPSLIPETNYRFSVRAVGPGGHSSPIIATTQTLSPASRPSGIVLENTTPDEITFVVEGPTDHVDNYVIRYRPIGEEDFTEIVQPDNEITLDNLIPGQQYEVEVHSVYGPETSNPVTQTFWTEDEPIPTPPTRPNGITLLSRSPHQVVFRVEVGNNDVDNFEVEFTPTDGDDTLPTSFSTDDSNPDITLDYLEPLTRYKLEVQSVKSDLNSVPIVTYFVTERLPDEDETPVETTSEETTTTHRITRTTTPEATSDDITPKNLHVTSLGVNDVTLQWTAPDNTAAVWRFFIQFRDTAFAGSQYRQRYISVDTPYTTLSRLHPNTNYEVILESIGNVGESSDQITTTFTTLPELTTYTADTRESAPVRRTTETAAVTTTTTTSSSTVETTATTPATSTSATTITVIPRRASTRTPKFEPTPEYEPELDAPQPLTGPKGMSVVRRGNKKATIRWTPADESDDVDGYVVEYKSTFNRHDAPEVKTMSGNASIVQLTDLVPGTEYQVKIYAMRNGEQSEPDTETFMTLLNSPGRVRATPMDNQIVVNWDNPEGPRTGTRFEYEKDDGPTREILLSPEKESFIIPTSGSGNTFTISVTALGRTIESTPATLTIHTRDFTPIEGTPVTFHDVTDNTAEIRFDNTKVVSPEGWVIKIQDKTDGIVGEPINLPVSSSSYPLNNLSPGHDYTVIVTNADETQLVGQSDFVTKADKPKNLEVSHVSPDDATITWESPDAPINGFVIQYKPVNEDREFTEVPLSKSDNSFILSNLQPSTLYEVNVFPTYIDNSTKRYQEPGISAVQHFTTLPRGVEPTPGTSPDTAPNPPSNIIFNEVTDNSARARWQPSPDLDVSLYGITLREDEGNKYVMSVNLRNSFASLTGLKPNTQYRLFVQSIRDNKRSIPVTANFYTGSNKPESVVITNVTDSSFDVKWTPEEPENPLLTGYKVSVVEQDSNNEPVAMDVTPDNTDVTIQSLQPGTSYTVSVTSLSNHMELEPVEKTETTRLPAPGRLYFSDITHESFDVDWDQPNSQVTEYLVEYGREGTTDFKRENVQDETTVSLVDLEPGTNYIVKVSSIFQRRRSHPITDSQMTLTPVEIAQPENVVAYERMPNSMVISWEPDHQREHLVRVTDQNNTPVFDERIPSDTSEVAVSNLLPTTEYVVYVVAVNPDTLAKSPPVVIRPRTKPPQPQNLHVAEAGPQFVVVEWDYVNIDGQPHLEYYVRYVPELGGEERAGVVQENAVELQELEPDTLYVITVQTKVDNDLSMETILTVTTDDDSVIYGSPQGIEVNHEPEEGSNGYLVTWEPVDEFDGGYVVRYKPTDGTRDYVTLVTEPGVTSQRITGLEPGTDYVIEVAPESENSEYSFGENTFSTVVPAPYEISVTNVGVTEADITWEAPTLYPITHYQVSLYPSSRPEEVIRHVVDARSPLSVRLTDLEPDTHYQVEVTSNINLLESSPATEEFRTKIELPTNFDAQIQPDSVTITWDEPDSEDDFSYELTFLEGGRRFKVFADRPEYILSNPQPDTPYTVEIAAINRNKNTVSSPLSGEFFVPGPDDYEPEGDQPEGDQPEGDQPEDEPPTTASETTASTITHAAPVPLSTTTEVHPAPLDSSPAENGDVRVRWQAYSGPVQYYKVVYRVLSSGKTNQVVIPAHLTNVLLNQLLPGKDYVVEVSAILHDNSERQIGQLTLESDTTQRDRSAIINWDQTNSAYSQYKIVATPLDNLQATVRTWQLPGTQTNAELTNLFPGTRYSVTVEGLKNNKYTLLNEFFIKTNVDTPTDLKVIKTQLTTISLSWSKPLANITGYKLTYQLGETGPETAYLPSPLKDATRHTLRTLSEGQLYIIRLYADSLGSESAPAIIRAETLVPQPRSFRTTGVTANLANVTWIKPEAQITHYTIRVVGPDGINIKDNVRLGSMADSYLIRDLRPGTKYYVYLTAWMNSVASHPAYRNVRTPASIPHVSTLTSVETESHDGFRLSWKGKSKKVEGWIIVVEPEDGSGFQREIKVDRFTKSYNLTGLRGDISYKVTIYPYSGSLRGTPSIITIPAQPGFSGGSLLRVQEHRTFTWRLNVPSISSDSITLNWNRPFDDVQGIESYHLRYKLQGEPDSSYIDVIPQPQNYDTSAVVSGLHPGQAYTIQLTATRVSGQDTYRNTLTLNVTTLLLPPTNFFVELGRGEATFKWNAPITSVDNYILQYREIIQGVETEYQQKEISGTATSTTLLNLNEGATYELRFFGKLGDIQTPVVSIQFQTPDAPPNTCYSEENGRTYQIGETWEAVANNFRMICTCDGPNIFSCNTGDWCQSNGNSYRKGETWPLEYENNKKEHCECNGREGFTCYFRSCLDENVWHDSEKVWYSESTSMMCECVCSTNVLVNCETRCSSVSPLQFERARRGSRGDE